MWEWLTPPYLGHRVAGGTESLVVSLDIAVFIKTYSLLAFLVRLRGRLEAAEAGSRVCRWSAHPRPGLGRYAELPGDASLYFNCGISRGTSRVSISPEMTPVAESLGGSPSPVALKPKPLHHCGSHRHPTTHRPLRPPIPTAEQSDCPVGSGVNSELVSSKNLFCISILML